MVAIFILDVFKQGACVAVGVTDFQWRDKGCVCVCEVEVLVLFCHSCWHNLIEENRCRPTATVFLSV